MEAESDDGGRNSEVVLKEWNQQIVVLLSMNVIYKTCSLAYHTRRHNCRGRMTWRRGRGDHGHRAKRPKPVLCTLFKAKQKQ